MTRYTTINHQRVRQGIMSPKSIQSYCDKKGLVKPRVEAVTLTADYVNARPFNWETLEFEHAGREEDHVGHMLGI